MAMRYGCAGLAVDRLRRSYGPSDIAAYARAVTGGEDAPLPADPAHLPGLASVLRHLALKRALELTGAGSPPIHLEEEAEIQAPLPPDGLLELQGSIAGVYDLDPYVLIEVRTTVGAPGAAPSTAMISRVLHAKEGPFDGDAPPRRVRAAAPADAAAVASPLVRRQERTAAEQARWFAACGDDNALHLDPAVARAAGFSRPPLQGLCTAGFMLRHVTEALAVEADPRSIRGYAVRFARPTFPGDTLLTVAQRAGPGLIAVAVTVPERGELVLSGVVRVSRRRGNRAAGE